MAWALLCLSRCDANALAIKYSATHVQLVCARNASMAGTVLVPHSHFLSLSLDLNKICDERPLSRGSLFSAAAAGDGPTADFILLRQICTRGSAHSAMKNAFSK